jgi:hypothetical protein
MPVSANSSFYPRFIAREQQHEDAGGLPESALILNNADWEVQAALVSQQRIWMEEDKASKLECKARRRS